MSAVAAWLERSMPWIAYPATIASVLFLHAVMRAEGASITLSAYLPVLIGAAIVTLLEWRFPEERAWRPQSSEVREDLFYMVVVQMLLPKLIGLSAAVFIADVAQDYPTLLWALWPHAWPIALQAALMILVADFLRYWLHRFSHEYRLLWRLHAIHHSPQRLYWLNVGRFHPLDKALQLLLDTLPFVLVGVRPEVIALYFVFYAVNGFFQHSNVKLRYGVLNYVISSAELHRWHHSRRIEESNNNYGNNVIIWDLLFGTRFLPSERRVGELGLLNRNYPMRFWKQLATPFTPDIVERDIPLQNLARVAGRWVFWLAMQWVRVTAWWPLRRAVRRPRRVQQRTLMRILRANADTRYGREREFAAIASYEEFARRVPIQDYERLRPYIDAQAAGETAALTREPPIMYAVTSGTTGEPKFVPVLESTVREYRQEQGLLAWVLFKHVPMAFTGKMLGMVSPAVEGRRPGGLPYGSMSGYLYENMPALLRLNSVVPPAVYGIEDPTLKYRVILRLALQEPEITYVAGANASSFLRMLAVLNDSRAALADSLARGTCAPLGDLPRATWRLVDRRLRQLPEAARALRALPAERELTLADFWPEIRLLTVWTGGSCGVAVEALKKKLPPSARVVELGYVASEFRGTVTIDPKTGAGLPTLRHHFLEFIEPQDWDAGRRQCLQLHELEENRDYYIIVTTGAGLYRYFMNDIVRVVGRYGATPTLRFMQKGRGVTSITGEKLYEAQLLQAVAEVGAGRALTPIFVMALADEAQNRYRLYLEIDPAAIDISTLAGEIDARLGALNIEYQGKRKSGRLAPLQLYRLKPGAGEAYKAYCVDRGQREGQFKTVALQHAREFDFDLSPYVVEQGAAA